MDEKLLEINNLKVSFYDQSQSDNQLQVVRGFETDLYKGEILGILGESGSGKTVSASSIIRLIDGDDGLINEGTVIFGGKNLTQMKERFLRKIRGRDISFIFQNATSALSPYKKIGKQLAQGLKNHHLNASKELILNALEEVGIHDIKRVYGMYPFQLSGGQNQRIMIAQAILSRPQLLIADEPTSSIDASIQKKILDLLKQINEKYNMSVIIITHDFDVAKYLCHRLVVMYGGLVVEMGEMNQIFQNPLHPYTDELIKCADSLDVGGDVLYTLDGAQPGPNEFEDCCPFYSRCKIRMNICKEKIPELKDLEGRKVRCVKVE